MQDLVIRGRGYWLQPFDTGDLPLLTELHGRAEVNRYIGREPGEWSRDCCLRWLEDTLACQDRHGFSPFKLMVEAPDGIGGHGGAQFAGWIGFTILSETSEIALHHCVDPEITAELPGLLEDISLDLIEWFFERTYFSHLVACVRTDDRIGRELVQSLGFGYRESRRMGDMPCDVFQRFSPSMQSLVANG
ncbi:GNAT family N-acetyltransferase [Roseibium aestuarii]|uniref:GNAT family N-acetyltransferase n=1 Tax=Roseibium aestuarii TaxID=2600299 RepID=A0ABW4K0N4_9HYPH|nr:GNAT family N-acetyltransferase [Roseibium aestuarii]